MRSGINLVRLMTNEDVVAMIVEHENAYELRDPMQVMYDGAFLKDALGDAYADEIEKSGAGQGTGFMMLMPWISFNIIRGDTIFVEKSKVLFCVEVTDRVVNYYTRIVDIMKMMKSGKSLEVLQNLTGGASKSRSFDEMFEKILGKKKESLDMDLDDEYNEDEEVERKKRNSKLN